MDLTVKKGELVMVIGSIGSGKSALVNSILGYLYKGPIGFNKVR